MRCFYCDNIGGKNTFVQLPEREDRHLFNTLRGRTGDTVQLIDGKGVLASARVVEGKRLLVLEREEWQEPSRKIHLFVSPPRQNRMDQLLTQCCEIGVWSITLVITEHSVVRPDEGEVSDKWKVHLIEGCKQSKNPFMPELRNVINFNNIFDDVKEMGIPAFYGSVADSAGGKNISGNVPGIAWVVGPEGGFSASEEEMMNSSGFMPLKIGKWIMRVETAAVAGAVLLMNCGEKC
jgi:16S rRNA (uracil1498-N3)-methyltransferase